MIQVQILTWQLSVDRVKPTSAELVEKYNAIAHRWQQKIQRFGYDKAYATLFAGLHNDLRNSFATHDTTSVLDCGLGSGALSAALYNAGVGDLALHGVDTSPAMVAASRSHLAQQGIPMRGGTHDMRSLPYDDNAFGMVMAAHTIEHLSQPQVGIREMVRVLRPGAPLLIVTTRSGLLGSLLDAQWGLTCLEEATLVETLVNAGLRDVQFLKLGGPFWCRYMSYAAIGWKREGIDHEMIQEFYPFI